MIRPEENLGGAGGFHAGVEAAYEQGYDRIWLMDDDVVPAPDCLDVLMAVDEDCLMAVREDTAGRLVEKAAVTFDLRNPLRIKPKTAMVETTYGTRDRMPELVEIQNVAFEGFLVRRRVVEAIGLPDPASSSSTTTSTSPSAPAAPASGSGRSATRSWSASSTSTSSTTCPGGRATTCTATSSPCTCGTARTRWSAPSPG